ncbi:VC2662 family protein [Celerinatantimonas yamalensis]|uniref:PhaC PHA synthase n=1 Tax=Celerinatantimonas yamalensis TaxID=559956 RepID=A0ABW9GBA2_9GAMM
MRKSAIVIAMASIFLSSMAHATGAQLSVPLHNFPDSNHVHGVRFSFLYGKTKNVSGLDLPIFALSDIDNFKGVQFSPFIGIGHIHGKFQGIGINLVNWHEGDDTGVNIGLVNFTHNVQGVNLGAVNINSDQSLVDIGLVNYAPSTTFQLGFVNATQNLQGLQIGLINYAANGIVPILPIVNFNKNF